MGSFAIFLYLSYYLQQVLGYEALQDGLAFLPFALVLIVGEGISGTVLLPRIGARPIIAIGSLMTAGSLLLLIRIDTTTSYLTGILASVLLFGLGIGLLFGCAQNIATSNVADDNAGVASAMVNTSQQVGGSLGLALFTSINAAALDSYITRHSSISQSDVQIQATLFSYHIVFFSAAIVFIITAIVVFVLFRPTSQLQTQSGGH